MTTIINKKTEIVNYDNLATMIQIKGKGDLYELFENSLPFPHEYRRYGDNYEIAYYVDGVFFTKKGTDYINDILTRFVSTFDNITHSTATTINKLDKEPINLKIFKQLNSIKKNGFTSSANKYEDSVFWSLKLYVEHMIKEGGYCPYFSLENFAFNHYVDIAKDKSTLKAKCRNIHKWYEKRNWESAEPYTAKLTKEEYLMTRQQNVKKLNDERAKATERKVIQTITGMFKDDYIKKSGKWNISKIAKEIAVSRNSIYKYIEKYEAEQEEKNKLI